jgi:RimJ/RimL family protein N-acetyltransferase
MTLQEIPSESFRERSIPVLETERLVLRAPRLGDVKAIAALANDRRIAENTARIPHPYKASDAEDFVTAANVGGETVFLIALRNVAGSGAILGACGFAQVDRHPPEIGYWLGVKHWGKGFATEAMRAVIDHAFTWRSAASSGPARGCAGCGRCRARCRWTASGSTAACGRR